MAERLETLPAKQVAWVRFPVPPDLRLVWKSGIFL
jgi:hypothetical protein